MQLLFNQNYEAIEGPSLIITDSIVKELYGKKLAASLNCPLIDFPSGEEHKSERTKRAIEKEMFELGIKRHHQVIALGGGVVCDLAGFVAATYMRGLPLILIPTTLLAMCDAAIGGKTGINLPFGKNLIGSIYPAKKVYINPPLLQTLPEEEWRAGAIEMVKHALIASRDLFIDLEKAPCFWQKDCASLLLRALAIKLQIVIDDPKEEGIRRRLNLGHTIGHALETLSDYSLPHGEAVAIGLIAELFLSPLTDEEFLRVMHLIKAMGFPLKLPRPFKRDEMLSVMKRDKKNRDGDIAFVELKEIGKAGETVARPLNDLLELMENHYDDINRLKEHLERRPYCHAL